MTKKGSSGAKARARGRQTRTGLTYTASRRNGAVCGALLDPWAVEGAVEGDRCVRPPHPEGELCSCSRDFDGPARRERYAAERDAEQARWDALTPEQQTEEEEWGRQQEQDEIMAAERPHGFYGKYYGDED